MACPLISVLTPAYNAENHIHRLLDSLLAQDYPSVEVIVVDDGSADHTQDVVLSYRNRLEAKGYQLNYIFQQNQGQSVAINNGLKLVTGKYLVWPDSDDFYSESSALSKMAAVLENASPDACIVRCLNIHIDEKTGQEVSRIPINENLDREDLFEDCLTGGHGVWFQPGGYMARMSSLDRAIAHREIYTEKRAGQNWQLLLPLFYHHRCLTIKEYLFTVVDRADSHSRTVAVSFDDMIAKERSYGNAILETLRRMPEMSETDRRHYFNKKAVDANSIYMERAIQYGMNTEARQFANEVQSHGGELALSAYFRIRLCDKWYFKYIEAIRWKLKGLLCGLL